MTATLAGFGVDARRPEGFFAECGFEAFGELEMDELVAADVLGFGRAEEAGAVDDSFGAGFEEALAVFGGLEASADLAGETLADHLDEGAVVALAHGGVEVDELDERVLLRSGRSSSRSRRRLV